jgi:acyl dehydratase
MPINPDAVGEKSEPSERSWDSKDALLYALGVGAGAEDPFKELEFTTENTTDVQQRVLPTMAVVLGPLGGAWGKVGTFNPAMLVHGEQGITLHREIPVSGTLRGTSEIIGIYDKGKGAVIATESKCVLADTGEPLFDLRMSAFIRGEGGFGGDRGPSGAKNVAPDRAPDHEATYTTRHDQALLYRLNGDRNPLHSDPAFAALGGFDRPILHGLCSYGFTGRMLLHTLCEGDPARFGSMDARFSSPVLPGETCTTRVWVTGDGEAVFQTVAADGRVVIDNGGATFLTK